MNLPSFTVADGHVDECLILAEKALAAGKFDKALAYATLALAWQNQRAFADRERSDGWPS